MTVSAPIKKRSKGHPCKYFRRAMKENIYSLSMRRRKILPKAHNNLIKLNKSKTGKLQ